ncbi:MAG: hypothetical protein KI792_06370 [Alphaproteobacteria bacterium]|nr:hypothetical protein [Alphaproteobacteria bacterium SS10]
MRAPSLFINRHSFGALALTALLGLPANAQTIAGQAPGYLPAAPRTPVATTAFNPLQAGHVVTGGAVVERAGILNVEGNTIRLLGIIVPLETAAQSRAAGDLIRLTNNQIVECAIVGTDTDGLALGACGTDTFPNLALAMIDSGRALVDRQQVAGTPVADLYLDAERQARRADLGLWGPEAGPVPRHLAGIPRSTPSDLAPPGRKPGMENLVASLGVGPVLRLQDGTEVPINTLVAAATQATPAAPAETMAADLSASFVPPDVPLPNARPTGTPPASQLDLYTLGLRELPGSEMSRQVASLDGPAPMVLEQQAAGVGNGLVSLIGHLDQVINRHQAAKDNGQLYLPTAPGQSPRTEPLNGGISFFGWLLLLSASGAFGAAAAYAYRWYSGLWPWERVTTEPAAVWAERQRQALVLAQELDREALNLSFALSERADIARLAAAKPSGRTAGDLRTLRVDPLNLITDNWDRIGRISRSIGLQARMLHSRMAEYDRRVSELATMAADGRLHESGHEVFGALAKRLDELSLESKALHQSLRQRTKAAKPKRRKQRRPASARTTARVKQDVRVAPLGPSVGGWSEVARA